MTIKQSVLVPALVAPNLDSFAVRQAIAGFLVGFGESTRDAYSLDLRQWMRWCASHDLAIFEVRRAHIELFARWLEEEGKARATVARRLSTIAGFYRYCVEEHLLEASPAVHVRRPRIDYESKAVGLDRNELGMFLVQAGLAGGRDQALACLLAGPERSADPRSARCGYRTPRCGTWPRHSDHHTEGRQDRHHPDGTPHRSSHRPVRR